MITMSLCNSLGNPTKNFRILTLPCHSQMTAMTVIMFFAEMPKWHQHYDHVLDPLYLTTTSHVCLYTFFQCAFVVPIFSPLFNPTAPFQGVLLYMAHHAIMPPHMAQPVAVHHQHVPPSPFKNDPSGISASSSSSDPSGGYSPNGLGSAGILENGFLFYNSTQRIIRDF